MNCDNAIDLIQRHIDNDLSEPELLELNAHLSICPSCSIMLARLQALNDQLLQLPKVTPKSSIVDAILPKLLEMEAQVQLHEESASLAVETQHAPIHEAVPGRRFFGYVSWKMTCAAAVAACAILFFILNQQDETQRHLASNIAVQDQAKVSAAPASEAPVAATADKGNYEPSITSSPVPELTPAASTSTENSAIETKDSSEVTALSNAGKAKTPADSKSLQSNTASPVPQPSLTYTPAEQTGSSVSEGSSNSVAVAPTAESGTGGGMTSLVAEPSTSPKKEDSNTYKRISNEQFVAEVKDRRLVISSIAANTVIFASLRQWTETDTVIPVGWTPEGKFYYEVTGNGAVRAFLVDVATRTELQIK